MKNITITEIRKYLKANGATLTKLKMRLNGNDTYKIDYDGGVEKVYTVDHLKDAFKHGAI